MGKASGKLLKAAYHGDTKNADEEYYMSLERFQMVDSPLSAARIKEITGALVNQTVKMLLLKPIQPTQHSDPSQPLHPGFEFSRPIARQKTIRRGENTTLGRALSFDHLCESFSGIFPQDFDDPGFDLDERRYKEEAARRFQENLGRSQFSELLTAGKYAEIAKRQDT
jgi:hypothetical protein